MPEESNEVLSHIEGVEYPASKQDLIGTAEARGARQEVVKALQVLDPRALRRPRGGRGGSGDGPATLTARRLAMGRMSRSAGDAGVGVQPTRRGCAGDPMPDG